MNRAGERWVWNGDDKYIGIWKKLPATQIYSDSAIKALKKLVSNNLRQQNSLLSQQGYLQEVQFKA